MVARIKRPALAAEVERVISAGDRDRESATLSARGKRQAVNVYLYPEQKAALDEAVRRTGISMSAYIWLAIREKLQRDG
jgi:Ribbon-helix-helix protein, copG family.